ncbi:FixH family protein [Thermochromatium tepidum]|jgi:Predicted integral membrane protein linked to a cation pump|uniref:Nitrogen fixation protein FixH n=1 Tax=Thermochromatium tepidum ATCC 43061 TaxID=316276 RepID=A0A6I6EF00_THETI|nr:FixH family protein [Thermochromatium tepidum]QGU33569.1 nitrogen fixation protein FixH [Thermochromatium tepidum ATCC 43061]
MMTPIQTRLRVHLQPNAALRNPWVLGWIGLVALVLGVNLVMVYLAFATNPGLVNADYYERGRNYERTVLTRQARDPGWLIRADIPASLQVGQTASIRVFFVDRAGQPVDPEAVTFHAYRPSDAARDFSLTMNREGRGRYGVETAFPLIGVWDTLIVARLGADEFSISERLRVGAP